MPNKTFNHKRFWRQTHYWGAIVCVLPILVIIITGTLLLLKKDISWVQPPTQKTASRAPAISKVRANSGWEIQLHPETAEILQVAYRRSELIEALHDGSFFHDRAKLGVFLPASIILLVLCLTGVYLFAVPLVARRRKRQREKIKEETRKSDNNLPITALLNTPFH